MTDITVAAERQKIIVSKKAQQCADRLEMRMNETLAKAALNAVVAPINLAEFIQLCFEDYATGPAARVPDGWQLVPRNPTREMYDALTASLDFQKGYAAMLAAAPQVQS